MSCSANWRRILEECLENDVVADILEHEVAHCCLVFVVKVVLLTGVSGCKLFVLRN